MNAAPLQSERLIRKAAVWKKVLWVSVGGIIIPPLIGLAGTVLGMIQAFDTVGRTGGSDPATLAENIRLALMTTAAGLVISLIFVIPLIVSLCVLKKLKRQATLQAPQQPA